MDKVNTPEPCFLPSCQPPLYVELSLNVTKVLSSSSFFSACSPSGFFCSSLGSSFVSGGFCSSGNFKDVIKVIFEEVGEQDYAKGDGKMTRRHLPEVKKIPKHSHL